MVLVLIIVKTDFKRHLAQILKSRTKERRVQSDLVIFLDSFYLPFLLHVDKIRFNSVLFKCHRQQKLPQGALCEVKTLQTNQEIDKRLKRTD